eukprot:PITA_24238
MLSCRLEFKCTNNTTKYEALIQGIYKEICLKVQYLKVFDDSEIVIKQVRNTIHCLSTHLKHYQSLVQDLISQFLAFYISPIARSQNATTDLLANVASKLLPSEDYNPDRFSVELIFRPSILDNVTNWRVFNHDEDILNFLTFDKSYDDQIIDEGDHDLQMKEKQEENSIPKPVVKLEYLCDIKDRLLAGASNIQESERTKDTEEINLISTTNPDSQYADLIFYLKNQYVPSNLSYKNTHSIRLKEKNFIIVDDVLFRRNYNSISLRWLEKHEAQKVLQELHDGSARGHFGADTTSHKIILAGYYWPTLFKDTHEYVRKCQSCQTTSGREEKSAFPLQPVNIEQPFEQWGLDIIGEITPHSPKQHRYILTATDYFTKWVEAIPLKRANSEEIIEFIDQFIITRLFKLKYSVNYYPEGNGLAESTNKNLIKIIKRTIEQNHKNWHKSLIFALWANRITQKASIGTSPFNLVYGKEVVIPTNLVLPSLALVQFIEESPSSSIQLRHDQILKLEEEREKAQIIHAKH